MLDVVIQLVGSSDCGKTLTETLPKQQKMCFSLFFKIIHFFQDCHFSNLCNNHDVGGGWETQHQGPYKRGYLKKERDENRSAEK